MSAEYSNIFMGKIIAAGKRARDILAYFPRRMGHLLYHLLAFRERASNLHRPWGAVELLHWTLELPLLFLDSAGISEIYETLADFIKFESRPLSVGERSLANSIFADSIDLDRVRLDERAWAGPRQAQVCYVSFYHINSWGPMSDDLLIHELVHVWQYENLGIRYIPRALRAQWTEEGYNYGGVTGLRAAAREGKGLLDFNYEQQADIVADYYRLREGRRPRWGWATASDLILYEAFIEDLKRNKMR